MSECKNWKEMKDVGKPKKWQDVPMGGIAYGSSAENVETGQWRSIRPVWNADECISCMLCWVQCPDRSIKVDENGKVTGIDYFYCKGCGICAQVCPKKAIEMRPEADLA
jgi:pyruvate ferredoxin oxidoreductase delta subunit